MTGLLHEGGGLGAVHHVDYQPRPAKNTRRDLQRLPLETGTAGIDHQVKSLVASIGTRRQTLQPVGLPRDSRVGNRQAVYQDLGLVEGAVDHCHGRKTCRRQWTQHACCCAASTNHQKSQAGQVRLFQATQHIGEQS